MPSEEPYYPTKQSAIFLDLTDRQVRRLVADGAFGDGVKKTIAGTLISATALASYAGRPLEPAKLRRLNRQANIEAAKHSGAYSVADTILLMRAGAEIQNRAWQGYLFRKNISIEGPPISDPMLRAQLNLQTFYTSDQVRELLSRAICMRDRDWGIWSDDPLERVSSPNGPGPFDWSELEANTEK